MAYYLTNLIQDVLGSLGRTESFTATGGTNATAINTALNELAIKDRPKNKDVIGSYLIVARDAGGAGAAPEGEYKRVASFDIATFTYNLGGGLTFSAALAANDELILTDPEFPLPDVVRAINDRITKITIAAVDTSQTTVSSQQDYSLPVTAKRERPLKLEIQTVAGDTESYIPYDSYDYIPSAVGSAGTLHFWENPSAGMTIRFTCKTYHPALTAFNSEVHQTIPTDLAKLAAKVGVMEWFVGLSDDDPASPWPRKLDIARNDLDIAMRERDRIWLPPRRNKRIPIPFVPYG